MPEWMTEVWVWAREAPAWQPVLAAAAIVGAAYFVRTVLAVGIGRWRWRGREKMVSDGLASDRDLRASTLTRYRGPEA